MVQSTPLCRNVLRRGWGHLPSQWLRLTPICGGLSRQARAQMLFISFGHWGHACIVHCQAEIRGCAAQPSLHGAPLTFLELSQGQSRAQPLNVLPRGRRSWSPVFLIFLTPRILWDSCVKSFVRHDTPHSHAKHTSLGTPRR